MSAKPLTTLITKKADADEDGVYEYIARKFGKDYPAIRSVLQQSRE